ncbi:hypothetical protein PC121_g14669 [Phytophthora cactorum]|nr:hypothetical protein PC120_g5214 [Phytophthora cactorum]KAG3057845.1 hypothetical protein PC121_g14669 [Phytophthora cactorum]
MIKHVKRSTSSTVAKLTTANSTVEKPDMDAMVYVRITLPERFGISTLVSCTETSSNELLKSSNNAKGIRSLRTCLMASELENNMDFHSKAKPRESSQRVKEQVATGEEEFGSILLVGLL